jgi:hypothetical protein
MENIEPIMIATADAIPSVVSPARTGQREMWRRMMRVS